MRLLVVWELLKETSIEWRENKAQRLAAALAYYVMFSLAPLLIILIGVAGLIWGDAAAEGQVVREIETLLGAQSAEAVRLLIASMRAPVPDALTAAVGGLALLFGASALFNHLKDSLNTIWGVARKPGHAVLGWMLDRLLAFIMVLLAAAVSLISFLVGLGLARLSAALGERAIGVPSAVLMDVAGALLSWWVITLLFAPLYKYLPDTTIAWRDVWVGAAMTAALLVAGQSAIGWYLHHSPIGSAYGVAGAIVVILVWVYYSAMILFFGAEFTWVYANRCGSRVMPANHAIALSVDARAMQGMLRAEELAAVARAAEEQAYREVGGHERDTRIELE